MNYYYGSKQIRELIGDGSNATTLGEIAQERIKYEPWCTYNCASKAGKKEVKKLGIPKSAILCPDCGNGLHWRKKKMSTDLMKGKVHNEKKEVSNQ